MLIGCHVKNPKMKKPFLIVGKDIMCGNCSSGQASYVYQDAALNEWTFYDDKNKYNIGDIIK